MFIVHVKKITYSVSGYIVKNITFFEEKQQKNASEIVQFSAYFSLYTIYTSSIMDTREFEKKNLKGEGICHTLI